MKTAKESLQNLIKTQGLTFALKLIGDIEQIVKVGYDGDILKFSRDAGIDLVSFSGTIQPNMFIDNLLVKQLGLSGNFNFKEIELGDFEFGTKNGIKYKFKARLYPVLYSYGIKWRVVGLSGSYGFGYSFISQRETLGKRYRLQIFQQIIDKYKLDEYISEQKPS
jgi:hypothetical protein